MYEFELERASGRVVNVNLTGVDSQNQVDQAAFTIKLFEFDDIKFQYGDGVKLTLGGAQRLYAYLSGLSAVCDAEVEAPLKFAEVGIDGLPAEMLRRIRGNKTLVASVLNGNEDAVVAFVESKLNKRDVVALSYRQAQVVRMESMLKEPAEFEAEKAAMGKSRDEDVWQQFFEENPWMLGQSLDLVCFGPIDEGKLEKVTTGASVVSGGKRTDALLASLGRVRSLSFVEFKHHKTRLTKKSAYRGEVFGPSNELAGAVAQSQKTVFKSMETIAARLETKDSEGFPTGQLFFNFAPRSYVVAGTLDEFKKDERVHEARFSSFEMYRRSTLAPQILTFDEILVRRSVGVSPVVAEA